MRPFPFIFPPFILYHFPISHCALPLFSCCLIQNLFQSFPNSAALILCPFAFLLSSCSYFHSSPSFYSWRCNRALLVLHLLLPNSASLFSSVSVTCRAQQNAVGCLTYNPLVWRLVAVLIIVPNQCLIIFCTPSPPPSSHLLPPTP